MNAGTELSKPLARSRGTGQAAAAEKNRERETRIRIIQELERLGIPRKDWPPFVQEPSGPEYRQSVRLDPFQPPDFERLQESPCDWVKKADAAWKVIAIDAGVAEDRVRKAATEVLRMAGWAE